jgi:TRAP-type C4-dicarboxylate transport system permease small subunit
MTTRASPATAKPAPRHTLRRALDGLYAGAGAVAALCVLAIFVLMIMAPLGRALAWRVGWINDVVAWLCAAAAFLGMAYSFRNGDFVRVGLLLEKLSPGPRRVLEIGALAVAVLAVSYLGFWAARFTFESWQIGDIAGNLVVIPMWIPQLSFVIGSFIFVVAVIDEAVTVLRGGKPSYVLRIEERHARGDFSEEL